jgi:hypothetical protein
MQSMARAFVAIERRTATGTPPSRGFPPAVGLAMSACESGWWASVTGANNYFGITRPPAHSGDAQSAWCKTTEFTTPTGLARFRDDERATAVLIDPAKGEYGMFRWFAVYPSLEAAVEAYVDLLIDSMRYHPAWLAYQKDGDSDKFLQAVCGLRDGACVQSGTRDRTPAKRPARRRHGAADSMTRNPRSDKH